MLAPDRLLEQKLPGEVLQGVARRAAARRKSAGLSQQALARKSGVTLGSLRRFEQTGQVSFSSLVNIAFALGCEDELEQLFAKPLFRSTDDVIRARRKSAQR